MGADQKKTVPPIIIAANKSYKSFGMGRTVVGLIHRFQSLIQGRRGLSKRTGRGGGEEKGNFYEYVINYCNKLL
jgi:hypothetical protein